MPDLACISNSRKKTTKIATKKAGKSNHHLDSSPIPRAKRKRPITDSDEELENTRITVQRSRSSSWVGSQAWKETFRTPPQKSLANYNFQYAHQERASGLRTQLMQVDGHSFQTQEIDNGFEGNDALMNDDVHTYLHDSGFSEGCFGDDEGFPSSPWSPYDSRSSPANLWAESNGMSVEGLQNSYSPQRSHYSQVRYTASISSPQSFANWPPSKQEYDLSHLPSFINFRSVRNGHFDKQESFVRQDSTVYGSLFEQDDPWSAIGRVLGITTTHKDLGISNEFGMAGEANSASEEEDKELATDFMLGEIEDNDEPTSDRQSETDDRPGDLSPELQMQRPMLEEEGRAIRYRGSSDKPEAMSTREIIDNGDFSEDMNEANPDTVDLQCGSTHRNHNHDIEECMARKYSDEVEYAGSLSKSLSDRASDPAIVNGVAAVKDTAMDEEITTVSLIPTTLKRDTLDDQTGFNDGKAPVISSKMDQLPEESECSPCRGEIVILSSTRRECSKGLKSPSTCDVLATPVLREVDGRFLGPSLFDDSAESEDDC
ncbi:hypothetical protein B0H34DRAFT_155174 [Crassisporium funariophilum]|nr:hypothetical protein B0H34DRAFT_155174 [Crassisporium funariophilum]